MTNLQRRIAKIEVQMTDPSGLVPHSQKWLAYWNRQIFNCMTDPDERRPAVRFPLGAYRAVMKYVSNPASMLGSIPGMLVVIRKRRFLDVRREGHGGLAELEAEVVEVAFRRRMGAEFVDDRSEIGQRADRGQSRCIGWAHQAA